jgi:hypothetical protein
VAPAGPISAPLARARSRSATQPVGTTLATASRMSGGLPSIRDDRTSSGTSRISDRQQPKGSYARCPGERQLPQRYVIASVFRRPSAQVQPGPKVGLSWGGSSSAIGVWGIRSTTERGPDDAGRSHVRLRHPGSGRLPLFRRGFGGQSDRAASNATFVSSSAAAAATATVLRCAGGAGLYVRRLEGSACIPSGSSAEGVLPQGATGLRTFMTKHQAQAVALRAAARKGAVSGDLLSGPQASAVIVRAVRLRPEALSRQRVVQAPLKAATSCARAQHGRGTARTARAAPGQCDVLGRDWVSRRETPRSATPEHRRESSPRLDGGARLSRHPLDRRTADPVRC